MVCVPQPNPIISTWRNVKSFLLASELDESTASVFFYSHWSANLNPGLESVTPPWLLSAPGSVSMIHKNLFSHPENTPWHKDTRSDLRAGKQAENQTYTGVESAEQGACVGSTIAYRPATWVSKASAIDSWFLQPVCRWLQELVGGERKSDKKGNRKTPRERSKGVERARTVCVSVSARRRARGDYFVLI